MLAQTLKASVSIRLGAPKPAWSRLSGATGQIRGKQVAVVGRHLKRGLTARSADESSKLGKRQSGIVAALEAEIISNDGRPKDDCRTLWRGREDVSASSVFR